MCGAAVPLSRSEAIVKGKLASEIACKRPHWFCARADRFAGSFLFSLLIYLYGQHCMFCFYTQSTAFRVQYLVQPVPFVTYAKSELKLAKQSGQCRATMRCVELETYLELYHRALEPNHDS